MQRYTFSAKYLLVTEIKILSIILAPAIYRVKIRCAENREWFRRTGGMRYLLYVSQKFQRQEICERLGQASVRRSTIVL